MTHKQEDQSNKSPQWDQKLTTPSRRIKPYQSLLKRNVGFPMNYRSVSSSRFRISKSNSSSRESTPQCKGQLNGQVLKDETNLNSDWLKGLIQKGKDILKNVNEEEERLREDSMRSKDLTDDNFPVLLKHENMLPFNNHIPPIDKPEILQSNQHTVKSSTPVVSSSHKKLSSQSMVNSEVENDEESSEADSLFGEDDNGDNNVNIQESDLEEGSSEEKEDEDRSDIFEDESELEADQYEEELDEEEQEYESISRQEREPSIVILSSDEEEEQNEQVENKVANATHIVPLPHTSHLASNLNTTSVLIPPHTHEVEQGSPYGYTEFSEEEPASNEDYSSIDEDDEEIRNEEVYAEDEKSRGEMSEEGDNIVTEDYNESEENEEESEDNIDQYEHVTVDFQKYMMPRNDTVPSQNTPVVSESNHGKLDSSGSSQHHTPKSEILYGEKGEEGHSDMEVDNQTSENESPEENNHFSNINDEVIKQHGIQQSEITGIEHYEIISDVEESEKSHSESGEESKSEDLSEPEDLSDLEEHESEEHDFEDEKYQLHDIFNQIQSHSTLSEQHVPNEKMEANDLTSNHALEAIAKDALSHLYEHYQTTIDPTSNESDQIGSQSIYLLQDPNAHSTKEVYDNQQINDAAIQEHLETTAPEINLVEHSKDKNEDELIEKNMTAHPDDEGNQCTSDEIGTTKEPSEPASANEASVCFSVDKSVHDIQLKPTKKSEQLTDHVDEYEVFVSNSVYSTSSQDDNAELFPSTDTYISPFASDPFNVTVDDAAKMKLQETLALLNKVVSPKSSEGAKPGNVAKEDSLDLKNNNNTIESENLDVEIETDKEKSGIENDKQDIQQESEKLDGQQNFDKRAFDPDSGKEGTKSDANARDDEIEIDIKFTESEPGKLTVQEDTDTKTEQIQVSDKQEINEVYQQAIDNKVSTLNNDDKNVKMKTEEKIEEVEINEKPVKFEANDVSPENDDIDASQYFSFTTIPRDVANLTETRVGIDSSQYYTVNDEPGVDKDIGEIDEEKIEEVMALNSEPEHVDNIESGRKNDHIEVTPSLPKDGYFDNENGTLGETSKSNDLEENKPFLIDHEGDIIMTESGGIESEDEQDISASNLEKEEIREDLDFQNGQMVDKKKHTETIHEDAAVGVNSEVDNEVLDILLSIHNGKTKNDDPSAQNVSTAFTEHIESFTETSSNEESSKESNEETKEETKEEASHISISTDGKTVSLDDEQASCDQTSGKINVIHSEEKENSQGIEQLELTEESVHTPTPVLNRAATLNEPSVAKRIFSSPLKAISAISFGVQKITNVANRFVEVMDAVETPERSDVDMENTTSEIEDDDEVANYVEKFKLDIEQSNKLIIEESETIQEKLNEFLQEDNEESDDVITNDQKTEANEVDVVTGNENAHDKSSIIDEESKRIEPFPIDNETQGETSNIPTLATNKSQKDIDKNLKYLQSKEDSKPIISQPTIAPTDFNTANKLFELAKDIDENTTAFAHEPINHINYSTTELKSFAPIQVIKKDDESELIDYPINLSLNETNEKNEGSVASMVASTMITTTPNDSSPHITATTEPSISEPHEVDEGTNHISNYSHISMELPSDPPSEDDAVEENIEPTKEPKQMEPVVETEEIVISKFTTEIQKDEDTSMNLANISENHDAEEQANTVQHSYHGQDAKLDLSSSPTELESPTQEKPEKKNNNKRKQRQKSSRQNKKRKTPITGSQLNSPGRSRPSSARGNHKKFRRGGSNSSNRKRT